MRHREALDLLLRHLVVLVLLHRFLGTKWVLWRMVYGRSRRLYFCRAQLAVSVYRVGRGPSDPPCPVLQCGLEGVDIVVFCC